MKAVIVGLALALGTQATPTIRSGEITPADTALLVSRIPRMPIDRFATLPPTVGVAFTQMNCQVPQPTERAALNVVQGEFGAKGQRDWAALCSDGTVTQIRIVWGGPTQCEDRLASTQDADTLVATAPNVYNYSRTIATASIGHIERLAVRYRATLPEAPEHDAIDDVIGRVGILRYCAGGQWVSVP